MNKVKYYRLISGLLLKDLSEKTGLSVGHLSHIENGNKQPSNQPIAEYYLNDDSVITKLEKPDYDRGGGKIDIIALALRLAVGEMEGVDGPLFLDEVGKVIAASGAGTITAHKIDSRLQRKAADNPHAKYNFSAKLKDPTSKGEEYIMFIGVSFDSAQLMNFELGELGEIEMDFTFDDFKYLKSIN